MAKRNSCFYGISPNKPLPQRLENEYWETMAKLILGHFYPILFADLSIDGESPDLRNEEYGIEVTICNHPKSHELENLYIRKYIYGNSFEKEKSLKRIEKLGGRVSDYCLAHPGMSRDLSIIYDRIATKTKKLNSTYTVFNSNSLFVFTELFIHERELLDLLKEFINISQQFPIGFNNIFLCCLGGDLYEFNIKLNTYTHHKNSHRVIQDLAIRARSIIVEKYSGSIS